jgi:parallel beta-helix repeat protein
MIQPNQVYLNRNRPGKGSLESLISKFSRLPYLVRGEGRTRRVPELAGILWAMILPLAVACLVSCAGFVPPTKSPTAPTPASTSPSVKSLEILTSTLPIGAVQSNYSATFVATGGVPPYSWTQTGGQFPAGLTLNSATGSISGTPTNPGTFAFTTNVRDSRASSVSNAFSLSVVKAPTAVARAVPIVAITAPSIGAAVSGIVTVSAAATDPQGGVTSVQFYLGGSPLGPVLTSSPYSIIWDTTQVADGSHSLSATAADATSNATASTAITVTVKNKSWSPAVLGVSWANDFTAIAANQVDVKADPRLKVRAIGDGVTDDTTAIRAAIQLASSTGGGVVYFPTGDYKIIALSNSAGGIPLAVPSRVILRGASPNTSRIFVNDPSAMSETDWTGTWGGIDFQGSSLSGMTDLGIYAVNASTSPCAVIWNRGSANVRELFFNNLDVHLDNCKSFWLEATDRLLVQNSHVDSNSSQYGPIYIAGDSDVSFLNNTVTYHFGRVHMPSNTNLLMQGNTLIRDAENKDMDDGTAIESGGVEISFCQNAQVLGNTIQTVNAPPDEFGDGEAIMSQQSNIQDVLDGGSSTAISSTTLTDANALWGPVTASRLAQYPEVVAILTGSAVGQWRAIQGVNTSTKTLALGQPWNPVPEVGSLYSIFAWTLMHATIQGNTLIDNPNGIVLWDGCLDCTVESNSLTNSRGIILRTVDESLDKSRYPEGRRNHQMAIDVKILNNSVSNTSGIRPAYIALDTEAFEANSYKGTGMTNVLVGGNTITPYAANPNQVYSPEHNEIQQEGFFPCFLFGPAMIKDPVTTVFQNITFWNNAQSATVTYNSQFLPLTTRRCVIPSASSSANAQQ